ncbi:hypothetical protein TNCV_2271991 [Trichonephila clavipes]|nr:hypothetical protein TNCV_2271991 [Trichonephila clavipes]
MRDGHVPGNTLLMDMDPIWWPPRQPIRIDFASRVSGRHGECESKSRRNHERGARIGAVEIVHESKQIRSRADLLADDTLGSFRRHLMRWN